MPEGASKSIRAVMRDALRDELPPRYDGEFWHEHFDAAVRARLRPGKRILDLGSGAKPAVPPERRPEGVEYVGLDISRHELERAPRGSYDSFHVADAVVAQPELEGRFDLVLSYLVMEHVKPLSAVVENTRAYLVPGGVMVSQLAGAFSLFAGLNRLVPHRVAVWGMERLLHRDPESVFPAHYNRCWHSALQPMFSNWSEAQIEPLYTSAGYLAFARPAQALYLGVEEWWVRRGMRNLAAYYLITAVR